MTVTKLEAVFPFLRVKPVLIEMELHPAFRQKELRAWCAVHGLQPVEGVGESAGLHLAEQPGRKRVQGSKLSRSSGWIPQRTSSSTSSSIFQRLVTQEP